MKVGFTLLMESSSVPAEFEYGSKESLTGAARCDQKGLYPQIMHMVYESSQVNPESSS